MTYTEAVLELFMRAQLDVPALDTCRVQVHANDGIWRNVPLEWNGAMRLADILDGQARLIEPDGEVTRVYPSREVLEHA